jgi:hypothetical protein
MFHKIVALIAAFILLASPQVFAQSGNAERQNNEQPSGSATQPQGKTGPIETKSGGASASSPQGDAPPGMQAAPKGPGVTAPSDNNGIAVGSPNK